MAIVNQDFVTFAGDSVSPIFTVLAADGTTPVNISGVTDIQWNAQLNLQSTAVLTKTMLTGGIVLVGGGTTGQFQVNLLTTDTAALSGWYIHTAALIGAGASKTTCTVGRMNVGLAPNWTYNAAQVATVPLYTVRNIIGDKIQSDQQLSDPEILWAISQYSSLWLAAAECCRNIAANYARMVDTVQGELRTLYSARTTRYTALAASLQSQGLARTGGGGAYVGGISVSDKETQVLDTDRVAPQFNIGEFDNYLPDGIVGHENSSYPSETGGNE